MAFLCKIFLFLSRMYKKIMYNIPIHAVYHPLWNKTEPKWCQALLEQLRLPFINICIYSDL